MKKYITFFSLLLSCICVLHAQNRVMLIPFSSGYTSPLGIENCGDSRLFVVQQSGQIIISDSAGNRLSAPFLNISDRISYNGEQGLLGLAFDPNYAGNGYFYVNYINKSGNTQVSRFKVSSDRNKADASSEKFILSVTQPYSNHNGGCIRFGPDGFLYIGMGDGGDGGDPDNYAQNPASLLGKMLRIDVHRGNPYAIPASNPFVDSAGYRPEIWAIGLRNPWRWSFDALSGALIIADVGQDKWEEVNIQQPKSKGGENYGWRCYEGNHNYNTSRCQSETNYKLPVYEYAHSAVTGDCSVTGGFVYRGKKYPALSGRYLCADYCSGIIRMLTVNGRNITETDVYNGDDYAYTSFGEDRKKELYIANFITGSIYRIVPSAGLQQQNDVITVASLHVMPNPSGGNFTVTYQSANAQQVSMRIQNVMGNQFYKAAKQVNKGTNTWRMSLRLTAGDYYISVTDATGKVTSQQLRIQ